MKIIEEISDRNSYLKNQIKDYCGHHVEGSRWTGILNKGISGLVFADTANNKKKFYYNVSVSFHECGIVIFFSNFNIQKLVMLKYTEISTVIFSKEEDMIKPLPYSVYSILKKMGVKEEIALRYLMPKEMIETNDPKIKITVEDTFFEFMEVKNNLDGVLNLFKQTVLKDKIRSEIKRPLFL